VYPLHYTAGALVQAHAPEGAALKTAGGPLLRCAKGAERRDTGSPGNAGSQGRANPKMNTAAPLNNERNPLDPGTRVQEFEILGMIGGGGFGIVYLAHDQALQRRVALKEYMPPLASRTAGTSHVFAASGRDTETFGTGLRSFVNEARLLARFDHPALVKVHRFWEENGTAYMVMPFYDGPTLQRAVAERRVPTDEAALRTMLYPLLDALSALHRERCYHRDISPDNILLTTSGPVLLDFGAARLAIGDASQNFTVILKEGYAPVEQYATEDATAMRQGPWTDIYALAGVVRYVITGRKPPSAVVRMASLSDPMEPLAQASGGRYSEGFLRALDAGMSIHVEKRPQSIEEFRTLLCAPLSAFEGVVPRRSAEEPPVFAADPTERMNTPQPAPQPTSRGRPHADSGHRGTLLPWAIALFVPLALAGAAIGYRFLPGARTPPPPAAQVPAPSHTPPPEPSAVAAAAPQPEASASSSSSHSAPPPHRHAAAPPVTPASGASQTASAQNPDAQITPPVADAQDEEARTPQGAHGQAARRPLNPALGMMVKAARAGTWGAVERRAILIARTADPPPTGDRVASRRANDAGLAELRAHRFPAAVAAFEKGVSADPSDIEVANNYGYALALAGRRPEAQDVLFGVLLRDPTRAVAWTALAEARSGDSIVALESLKIALHFAASRERTLAKFAEMALSHPDPRMRLLAAAVLQQRDQIPTVPEGLP
jgi:serine/threonine protein kinase